MDDRELVVFEIYEQIEKSSSPEAAAKDDKDLKEWRKEMDRLEKMLPVHVSGDRVKVKDIPALEKQIKTTESEILPTSEQCEQAEQKVADFKEIHDVSMLKQHAVAITKNHSEIERLKTEIAHLKEELSSTGTSKTPDDVQTELDSLSNEMYVHVYNFLELDAKLAEAQAPIERLEQEYQHVQTEPNPKLVEAQRSTQEMNMSVDKLDNINKVVDRRITEFGIKIDSVRETVVKIDREINESGSLISRSRDNIQATQAGIDSHDMEGAAKAKRQFEDRYQAEKQRETEMRSKYAYIGGEISSHNETLKQVEKDLREYKYINKRCTDQ
ncbi:hypothetical protein JVU11DRAFT_7085 [Chiua virens]|nr:hypothetical protein JVU11DRAFT_7085 [Chiua virens]